MRTKKNDDGPPLLVRDKQELKDQIQKRIKLGEEILAVPVTNNQERAQAWAEFRAWDNLNHEIIISAFDVRQHPHSYQYEYKPNFDLAYLGYGNRKQKNFEEIVEDEKNAVRQQLKKLELFHEKIDLQHSAPALAKSVTAPDSIKDLKKILNRFHKVAQKLRERHDERETIIIKDEYDVQDLLYGLLQIDFDDVRSEDYSPSSGGANSRIDFVLKLLGILLEVKMTSEKLTDKKLSEELYIDIARYKEYPNVKDLVIFIYDKGDYVRNKAGLIRDLEKQSTANFKVTVVVNPH